MQPRKLVMRHIIAATPILAVFAPHAVKEGTAWELIVVTAVMTAIVEATMNVKISMVQAFPAVHQPNQNVHPKVEHGT